MTGECDDFQGLARLTEWLSFLGVAFHLIDQPAHSGIRRARVVVLGQLMQWREVDRQGYASHIEVLFR